VDRRSQLAEFLSPEASPEPLLHYREGVPALMSFVAFAVLLAPPLVVLFAVSDSEAPPSWAIPFIVGLPAFVCGFLLPQRRRRQVALFVVCVDVAIVVLVVAAFVLFIIAKASCGPDAYECPF